MKADPATEEERLLIEAAQRNPGRFAELYERNFERVYAYVARRVGSREEAEDVTVEVFQQALANLPQFEWRGWPLPPGCGGWLRTRLPTDGTLRAGNLANRRASRPAKKISSGAPCFSSWWTRCRRISGA